MKALTCVWFRPVAWVHVYADELAKMSAAKDGAEMAEWVVKGVLNTRKRVYAAMRHAAIFHDEVGESVDVEEVSEDKNKPK